MFGLRRSLGQQSVLSHEMRPWKSFIKTQRTSQYVSVVVAGQLCKVPNGEQFLAQNNWQLHLPYCCVITSNEWGTLIVKFNVMPSGLEAAISWIEGVIRKAWFFDEVSWKKKLCQGVPGGEAYAIFPVIHFGIKNIFVRWKKINFRSPNHISSYLFLVLDETFWVNSK